MNLTKTDLQIMDEINLREKYRAALLRLADLVDYFSTEGEEAFHKQDRLCHFLHDQLFDLEFSELSEKPMKA